MFKETVYPFSRAAIKETEHALAWTILELYEAVVARWEEGDIDNTNLKALCADLETDGEIIVKRLRGKLLDSLAVKCRTKELCPECFTRLEDCDYVSVSSEAHGYVQYHREATGRGCPECDYREKL